MNSSREGFLVVLSDVKSETNRDYLSWLTTEHVQERLAIPGFLAVRIFRKAIAGGHRYLIWYRLESAGIVDSPAYLERLNNPTAWSRRIMPTLGNFGRGGGEVAALAGNEAGSLILAVEVADRLADAASITSKLKAMAEIKSTHLLNTDSEKSKIQTNERALRASDNSFMGLLLMESESQNALNNAASALPAQLGSSTSGLIGGLYREVFALANLNSEAAAVTAR